MKWKQVGSGLQLEVGVGHKYICTQQSNFPGIKCLTTVDCLIFDGRPSFVVDDAGGCIVVAAVVQLVACAVVAAAGKSAVLASTAGVAWCRSGFGRHVLCWNYCCV